MVQEEKKPRFTWQQKRMALWRQLRPHRTLLWGLSVLGALSAVANGVIPYIMGKFFDSLVIPYEVVLQGVNVYAWAALLTSWMLAQFFANGLDWFIDRNRRTLTTSLEAGIQARAFTHLLTLPVAYHKHHRTGEITDLVSKAGWMLGSLAGNVISLAPRFLTIVIGIAISFTIKSFLAWLLLGGVVLYLVVLVRVLPKTARYQEEGFRIWNRAYGDGADAYANVQTVKQAGAEQYEEKRIMIGFFERAVPIWNRMEQAWNNLNFSQRVIVALTQGVILLISVFLVGEGSMTVGDLIAFNAYAGMILGPFVSLGHEWQTIQNGLTAVARSETIFGAESEVYVPAGGGGFSRIPGPREFQNRQFCF